MKRQPKITEISNYWNKKRADYNKVVGVAFFYCIAKKTGTAPLFFLHPFFFFALQKKKVRAAQKWRSGGVFFAPLLHNVDGTAPQSKKMSKKKQRSGRRQCSEKIEQMNLILFRPGRNAV